MPCRGGREERKGMLMEMQVELLHWSGDFGNGAVEQELSYSQRMQLRKDGMENSTGHGDSRGLRKRKRRMRCWHRQSSGRRIGTGDRA